MDDRQRTIVEGAGLEESRLNQDFIEWLRKWGTPILMVVVVVSGGYAAWNMWARFQERSHDEAYAQFHAAAVAGSPDNLVVVAEQHRGKGAIYEMALIEAADAYLASARTGVRPGGSSDNAEDLLDEEQRQSNLRRAGELYQSLLDATAKSPRGRELHTLNGLFGVAAVAESAGQTDRAREHLSSAAELAERAAFPKIAEVARERIATLDTLSAAPRLYERSEVRSSANSSPMTPARPVQPIVPSPDPFTGGVGPLAPPSEDAPTP